MRKFMQLILSGVFLVASINVHAQQLTKGSVKSSTGEPVIGASVSIKGKKGGTVTNNDGVFSIRAEQGTMLVISSISFETKEVTVRPDMEIMLEPKVNQLQEIEVLVEKGYGKSKKAAVSSVISTVKGADLASLPSTNLGSVLQGRATGVQVTHLGGSNPPVQKIQIRGFTTLNTSSDPLIIMDGVNLGRGNLNFINLADVENIDILKDASATAIYGSDASGGVIIISTKKGKKGKFQTDVDVSYGNEFYKNPNMASAPEYIEVQKRRNIGYTPPANATNTDWWNAAVRNTNLINANISFSGGSEKVSAYGSLGYVKTEGPFYKGKWQKVMTRLNVDFTPNNIFKMGLNLYPRFENWESPGLGDLMPTMRTEPTLPIYVSRPNLNKFSQYSQSNIERNVNPVAAIDRTFNYNYQIGLIGGMYAEISPVRDLRVRTQMSINTDQRYSRGYVPPYNNGNLDRNFDLNNPASLDQSDYAYNSSSHAFNWIWSNTAHYAYNIGSKHHLSVLAGYEARKEQGYSNHVSRFKVPDPLNHDLYYVDAATGNVRNSGGLRYGDTWVSIFGRLNYEFDNKYFLEANMRRDGSSRFFEENKYAIFPSVSASWIATNENFLKGFEHLNFLKARASWGRVGNSSLNDPGAYIDFLNTVLLGYQGPTGQTFGDPRTTYPIAALGRPKNVSLKWETNEDMNFGFDSYWLKNRLYVNFEWFTRKSIDVLYQDAVGRPDLGIAAGQWLNLGVIKNKGFESTIGYKSSLGRKFRYDLSLNVSTVKTTLEKLGIIGDPVVYTTQGPYRISEDLGGPVTKTEQNGGQIGLFWGYQVLGVFQTQAEIDAYAKSGAKIQPDAVPGDFKYQDTDGNGIINDKDRVNLGSPYPKFEAGFTIKAEYKGFDVSILVYGRFGHKALWMGKKWFVMGALGSNVIEGSLNKAWNGAGSTNDYPRFVQDNADANKNLTRFSSWFIEKGDYVRINNIQLGYTVPEKWSAKGIRKIRVYANLQNPFIFTKYPGLNPEFYYDRLAPGIDYSQFPIKKSVTVGVNIGL